MRKKLMMVARISSGTCAARCFIMLGQNRPTQPSNTQKATSCTCPCQLMPARAHAQPQLSSAIRPHKTHSPLSPAHITLILYYLSTHMQPTHFPIPSRHRPSAFLQLTLLNSQ
jgi:hypothetical protein